MSTYQQTELIASVTVYTHFSSSLVHLQCTALYSHEYSKVLLGVLQSSKLYSVSFALYTPLYNSHEVFPQMVSVSAKSYKFWCNS